MILPGDYLEPSGIVRLNPASPGSGEAERKALTEISGPAPILLVGEPPSFADQLGVYATHQELIPYVLPSELGFLGKSLDPSVEDVIGLVRTLPFEPAMWFISSAQKVLVLTPTDRAGQLRVARAVYRDTPILSAAARFLRAHERGVVISEQQLFALQRLLILHARDVDADDLSPDELDSIRLALFFLPGTVLDAGQSVVGDATDVDDERWLRYFVGNGGLVERRALGHDLARAHRMYDVIAKSSRARRYHDYCPLDEWLRERYMLSFVEFQGLGLGLYAGSRILAKTVPPVTVTANFYATTSLGDRVERGFEALAEERSWFREQFESSPEHPRWAAFETQPFLRRPALRLRDGRLMVLAPRAIEGWLSATGTYYRLLDLARDRSDQEMDRFRRFNGWIQENYVRHLAHAALPGKRSLPGSGRVIPEITYRVPRRGELKTSDVAVDLGIDLVLIEVTSKRLTLKSLVEADAEAVRDDLRMLVVEKMEQLGRVIDDISAGRVTLLPDLDPQYVKRFWPIVVSADGVFLNPSLWDYLETNARPLLEAKLTEAVTARVMPLVLLDLEEFETLMGIVSEEEALIRVLERKTSPNWVGRDFKSWHNDDLHSIGSGESVFITTELHRAFRTVSVALGLRRRE